MLTLLESSFSLSLDPKTKEEIRSALFSQLATGGTYRDAKGVSLDFPAAPNIKSDDTLDDIFKMTGWELLYDKQDEEKSCRGIRLIEPYSNPMKKFFDILFCLIAPWVMEGSFLELRYSRDDESILHWRWAFRDGQCVFQIAKTTTITDWVPHIRYRLNFTIDGTITVEAESEEAAQKLGAEIMSIYTSDSNPRDAIKVTSLDVSHKS